MGVGGGGVYNFVLEERLRSPGLVQLSVLVFWFWGLLIPSSRASSRSLRVCARTSICFIRNEIVAKPIQKAPNAVAVIVNSEAWGPPQFHWEVLNGVGVDGVGVIFPFFYAFFPFFYAILPFFCAFLPFFYAFLPFFCAFFPFFYAFFPFFYARGISLRPRLHRPRAELPDFRKNALGVKRPFSRVPGYSRSSSWNSKFHSRNGIPRLEQY